MTDYVMICTTVEREDQAGEIARQAVEGSLAACVQIAPIKSIYKWKGQMECADEYRLIFKTTFERKPALLEAIRLWHPYEVPEIIVQPIQEGHPAYLSWIRDACSAT